MHTTLRKIGNSRGIIIPAALLSQGGFAENVDLRLEGTRIIIEPIKAPRQNWFQDYDRAQDVDAWGDLPVDADASDWEW
jgi:antitoxin MazE